jgi:hypothetical protein
MRTIQSSRKDMPHDFVSKQLKFKRGDVMVKTRGGLTTLVWKDRGEVYMLTNTDSPPAKENFCDESNCPVTPHTIEWYKWHMRSMNNSNCMTNSYSMSPRTFK